MVRYYFVSVENEYGKSLYANTFAAKDRKTLNRAIEKEGFGYPDVIKVQQIDSTTFYEYGEDLRPMRKKILASVKKKGYWLDVPTYG
jgi:hypothetical protein